MAPRPAYPLRVAVILRQGQLRWRCLGRLLDGLTGPLGLAGVLTAPDAAADLPGWLARVVTTEEKLLGLAPDAPAPPHRALSNGLPPCDVIVDFRAAPTSVDLAAQARFGAWQISGHSPGTLAASVMADDSAVTCALTCRTGPGTPATEFARTRVQTKSLIAPSQVFASEKSVQLLLHHLRRLALTGALPAGTTPAPSACPTPKALPRYWARVARRAAQRFHAKVRQTKPFGLRIGFGDLPDIDPATGTDVPPEPGSFAADPFLIEHQGALYCFYEELPFDTGRGHIAVARVTDQGATRLGVALATEYHLSFPYVFAVGDTLFMMPETLSADRIEVWRCTDFPLGWTRHATGPEGLRLADPVLVPLDGTWWLFGNSCHDSLGDFSSELCLYRADGPDLRALEPHPLNPVVVGSDVARNAGRVLRRDGRLFRLSQDNSGPHYGYGLNVMEITALSDTTYAETRVAHHTPATIPGAIGCHHADAAAGRFVVDLRWP